MILPYLKTYAAMIGAIVTALLTTVDASSQVHAVLVVVGIVATAVATFAIPNKDPQATHQGDSVQPPRA